MSEANAGKPRQGEAAFKDTPLGPLPVEWDVAPVSALARVLYGRARPETEGLVPAIGSGGVYAWVSRPLVSYPTLIVGRKGTAGMVWFQESPCWPSDTTFYLQWKDFPIDHRFVHHCFQARPLSGQHSQTTLPSLTRADVETYQIPLPPLAEQRAIAATLRAVQRAREATEGVIEATRELKRSLMRHLFTYGPVPVGQVVETRETEVGTIPAQWEIAPLGELFDVKLGKMLSSAARQGVNPRPYLRNANVQWGRIDLSDLKEMDFSPNEMVTFRLRKGDILVCEGGEIGRTAIWEDQLQECYYQKAVHRLRPTRSSILAYYFLHYMVLLLLVRRIPVVEGARSTIAHLPVAKLERLPVVVPSLAEQQAIEDMLGAVDAKLAAEEGRRAALDELFASLLHNLMTGKVRVPVQALH